MGKAAALEAAQKAAAADKASALDEAKNAAAKDEAAALQAATQLVPEHWEMFQKAAKPVIEDCIGQILEGASKQFSNKRRRSDDQSFA